MSRNIANHVTNEAVKRVLGCIVEAERRLLDGGLELSDFQVIVDDPERRSRLIDYWKAGMPKVDFWKVWRTIKCNPALKRSKHFLSAFSKKGLKISDRAKDIMLKDDFKKSFKGNSGQEYDLFLLTTSQLIGKANGGTTQEVFAGAKRLGFQKCPAWIGPQLRLNYEDQSNGEWIRIGMETITDSNDGLRTFNVYRNGSELWLSAYYVNPDNVWHPDYLWVFCRPCK